MSQPSRWLSIGPYPVISRAQMRAGLDLLPTWALEQRRPPTARSSPSCASGWPTGEVVARMYQEPGLAWLERQAQVAEELIAERKARDGQV